MSIGRLIKRFLPTSLFGRALMILIVPVVILQLMIAYIFYERHWDSVVRNLSSAASGNVALLVNEFERNRILLGSEAAMERMEPLAMGMGMRLWLDRANNATMGPNTDAFRFREFRSNLDRVIDFPVRVSESSSGKQVRVNVKTDVGILRISMDRKRLASSTTYIFILWMVGTALLLTAIAVMFLRNQIRPIVQLARVAEQFGLGQDVQGYAPRGASEVRRAGRAFTTMADRVRRAIQSRTEMLAGISHDLRTPLTRMKLEIEMGKIDPQTRDALHADIEEMRHMIDEYLDFARGDAGETMEPVQIHMLLADIVENYTRQSRAVSLAPCEAVMLNARPQALRRCLQNLIDNALRYGKKAHVSLEVSTTFVRVKVLDEGEGIPDAQQQDVFKPFLRLESSRNVKTGGVGLGLSIARDVAQSHGGDITLENQKDAKGKILGLEVTVRLPRAMVK
ncbi:MAG: two-component sensor histidine kinase [Alphaproteobacteria bacterium]|nr:two-component sensor histidine kinase [Alphaproteobacteria bacterium]